MARGSDGARLIDGSPLALPPPADPLTHKGLGNLCSRLTPPLSWLLDPGLEVRIAPRAPGPNPPKPTRMKWATFNSLDGAQRAALLMTDHPQADLVETLRQRSIPFVRMRAPPKLPPSHPTTHAGRKCRVHQVDRAGRRSEGVDLDQFNLALEDLGQQLPRARPNRRRPIRRCARPDRKSGTRGAARCPSICRGSRSSSNLKIPPARAAAARCIL
jgi:hypothetical protein